MTDTHRQLPQSQIGLINITLSLAHLTSYIVQHVKFKQKSMHAAMHTSMHTAVNIIAQLYV